MDKQDAIIIGAGIIGAATALELSKRGYATLNLDTLPASGYGPTSNSCAIVRFFYSSRDGVAMAHESAAFWEDWSEYIGVADDSGLARYERCGCLQLKAANGQHEPSVRQYEALGVEFEDWDREEVEARFPIFDMGDFSPPRRPDDRRFREPAHGTVPGGIFNPGAGYVNDPQLATHNLQRAAEAAGGRFEFGQTVTEIHCAGDRVSGVSLADGRRLEAPIVVNVAGPHSPRVNAMAGALEDMKITTRALRHEVHHVPSPPGFDFERQGCVVSDGDVGVYYRPAPGNHILVGSEDPECDPREWVADPDDYDRAVTEAQYEAQVFRLARRIPGLKIPTARQGVVDLYDVSDDWIPIYDRSCVDGFYMAIGTSGNQFKNAPVAGELMAELIDRVENGHDHDADPVRITGRYTGHELSGGFYSRLREVNEESSFSVRG
ncbi:MAG: FAD-dependent oxidoreductase [Solirubrobacterales bacterium]